VSRMVGSGSKYTDEQRTQAAIQYAIEGNLKKIEREQGIPNTTLSHWRLHSDWWDEAVARVRAEKADEHIAQYLQTVSVAQEITLAKLPEASAAQAHLIACQATDKAQLLMGLPTSIRGDSSTVQALADEFRKLSADHKAIQESVVSTQESKT